ncbi:sigma-54-dependent Fis family transcriptional regulator [Methylocella tundrae]|uniref:Transcriptional regulatory protein XylR n=1 Tax=Methylocella tundrae TaxID=227605 RepID=A0A4U8Z5H3_METTU|nr:sigma-54-dependent Fis family transcriptional regulator [Methylocella tundrae]WPP04400.1 sigma-54-dependent Fis family transcriptional regulator [Methylocella tundrae]VFU10759.1 Transcriptional regulatory protein XylR [Methylocella tundrae]
MDSSTTVGVDIGHLSARLRFNPEEGCIWLEGQRMLMLHLTAFASLRRELIDTFGIEVARGLITRMGHASGAADAALARRTKPDMGIRESFMIGPGLHALEGMVAVEPVLLDVDPETDVYAGEWIWRNSAEVDAHLHAYGISAEPVCWALLGYASAFTSAYMGLPVLYREVECRATGAAHCRIIGKPADQWDDAVRDDLHQGFDLADTQAEAGSSWASVCGEPDHPGGWPHDRMVGASAGFVAMMHMVDKVARTDAVVMLIGEPGAGKKSCARLLHKLSARCSKPFVAFNCAALSCDQLDVDLFGVEKSTSASGPQVSRSGRIERANGGTLFLEDVHRLDLRAQTKLLRVLQTGEVERVGGAQPRPVHIRVVASSNARLIDAMRDGSFREDLYYRLTTFPIVVPPLRERRTDLPLLIRHFLDVFSRRYGKKITGVSEMAVGYLLTHDFPGNVTELESMIERAIIMAPNRGPLDVAYLTSPIDERNPRIYGLSNHGLLIPKRDDGGARHDTGALDRLLDSKFELESFENELIARAVERAAGNLSKAAKALGLTRPQLAYRYRKVQEGAPGAQSGDLRTD